MTDNQAALEEIRLSLLALKLGQEGVERRLDALEKRIALLVTRREFDPLKQLAFALVFLVLAAVTTGVLAFVIRIPSLIP